MAKFKVRITEKLARTVLVEAENSQKAEQEVTTTEQNMACLGLSA